MADNLQSWFTSLFAPGLSDLWVSGLVGAGGAVLGSFVTILWTELFNHRSRKRERRAKNAVAAFGVYQKLIQIYTGVTTVRTHLTTQFGEAKQAGLPFLCFRVQPLNSLSGPLHFTTDELWALSDIAGSRLINRVNSLDDGFNVVCDVVDHYRTIRAPIWDKLKPVDAQGVVGTLQIEMTPKQRLDFAALDLMLTQTAEICEGLVRDTFEAVTLLVHSPTKPLGKTMSIKVPDPNGKLVHIQAAEAPRRAKWWWKGFDEPPPHSWVARRSRVLRRFKGA